MKNKSTKHKSVNTFKFVPFAERINSIDIRRSALYHIEHAYAGQPEENETHFHVAIQKWHALNLTENFKKFRREVFGVVTVPQLVHRKDNILEILEKYLNLDDSLCLQPLLEILVAISKDLRDEFYPHFTKFLDILIKLLDTKDAEKLEWILICLAFLFKTLKPYLKKDIAVILKKIIPLLSENHPQYINNFAAESFAFVARDIRDKVKFINLFLNFLETNQSAVTGCGHLIFEIFRGVGGKFHHCVETFLPLLLQHLQKNKKHQKILFNVLTQTLEDSLHSISPKEFEIFWTLTAKFIEEGLKNDDDENKGLEYIMRLGGQVIEHHQGKYLTNPPQFVLLLVKVICESSSESLQEVCSQIGALLLLSPNISLSQEHAGIIVKVLLHLPYPKILMNFVENVVNYSQFDIHILPHFLRFVVQSKFDNEAMAILSKICISKSPVAKNGIKLFEWVKYPLDFGKDLNLFRDYLSNVMKTNEEEVLNDPEKLINLLFCLPHVEKIDTDVYIRKMSELIASLLKQLTRLTLEAQIGKDKLSYDTSLESKQARKMLFLLSIATESAVHMTSCKRVNEICDIGMFLPVILPLASDPNYLAALHLTDLYLTAYEQENGLSLKYLSLVDSYLKDNITSPFHIVRLLSTHIYKLFENIEELNKTAEVGGNTERFAIFSNCYAVESITPSIQEYRAQINLLQKMTFNTTQYALAKDTEYHLYALNYMLGALYFNFKLLWEPVSEFIAGYGNSLNADDFWPVFHKTLEYSFVNARKNINSYQFGELEANIKQINELYRAYNDISERVDLYNYRNLILKIMPNCIQVCEAKNREVVVLFLNFINDEYRRNDSANALKTNVEIYNSENKMDVDPKDEEDTEDVIPDDPDDKETVSGKIVFKTLINIMQVLSQFKNPRALHKEPIFWELYMEFLKHKNPGLQKYALDCVLNYKNKSITAYKDNLSNLVDEKKLKDELTQFKITEDAKVIQVDDRKHVIPIIMRILYGKMTSKLGADKKGGGQTRRALVMRYLAGCNEEELRTFIEMAFTHLKEYMSMSACEVNKSIILSLDLKCILSPGKLHSILNLFEVVREYFGGYMKDALLSDLFKIFYAVSTIIAAVIANGDKVHVGYIKVMKNLRNLSLATLRKLFEQFDKYPWSKEELDVLFETLINPLVPKLHVEGIHSPTALLRLFNVWCQNPRYYVLLVTSAKTDTSVNPLSGIFKLLLAPKTTRGVVNMILDMIEKLLTLVEDEEDNNIPKIDIICKIEVDKLESVKAQTINFGSKILIPHIAQILEVMKRRIANSVKATTMNKRDLLILSRVTELVSTPELCDDLLNILLPILVKKVCMNMAEDNMEYAVTTIINLLGHSSYPQMYLKNIAVLFNKVSPVDVRKLLLKLLVSIAENAKKNKEALTRLANVVTEMNAFNKRWIEQPDFDRRLDAYKEIYQLSEKNEIDVDLAILIVNNCFYFIRTEKDIGLRDSAALCLKRILPKLMTKYWSTTDGQFLVKDTVLALISTGIRDTKNEVLRNESIALLGDLARACPDTDVVLSDLAHLTCKEDVEVDFFENMCHLQMHRRVRALLKFCKVAKKVTKCPSPRTLTNFILPLASGYICDEKYTDKNTLIDACIDTIATCCRLLPWYHYEVILKLYLNKIRHSSDYHKQLTRILVGILDAFHFDFSKVKDIELPKSLLVNVDFVPKKFKDNDNDTTKIDENETKQVEPQEKDKIDENYENPNAEPVKNKEDTQDVDQELLEADQEAANEEKENSTTTTNTLPAYELITVVTPSVAKRIIKSLSSGLLPQLNRSIGKLTEHEESHKVNRKRASFDRQEEDLLRVPIALALVKLLQRLPGDLLRFQLSGIIIKLCSFLKSPLKQVRITARDIVKKIMITVGPSYLGVLLEHLTMLLTRGFQVHVLVATIHNVLDALKNDFKPGDLNDNLHYILDVCTNDLFGAVSEEKEVEKLHYKTPEAKPSKKSYVTLAIVSQNITEKCLINLLLPFKEVLQNHQSKKIVLKVQDALNHISTGLVTNKFIDIESLFIFLHGVASESIPQFVLGAPKREINDAQKERMLTAKPDCFIIPVAPKRNKEAQAKNVKTCSKASAHVLVEFSLNMLYIILKREKVSRVDCRAFVDPLVPLLVDALKSDQVKVATVAMKCIATLWTIRVSTPTLEEMVKDIVKTIFTVLHKYATFEISSQNDNYHLVRVAFKAVTVLIRNVKYYTVESDQLKTLLLYAEEDCQNDERQANSFNLLKAILEARLVSSELHEVMQKISKICILSESARSRDEARVIFLNYLTNYSPGKRMEKFLQFFVSQLNYELQHGRESSLKFLEMIIAKMQVGQLKSHGEFLFLSLGTAMVNDSAPECREHAAKCIECMLKRFDTLFRNKLFDLAVQFFKDTQPVHFEFAAQLCIRFVNIENEDFKNRLTNLLPILTGRIQLLSHDLTEGRFVKIQLQQEDDKTDEEKQKEKDHSLIQILNLIDSITVTCESSLRNVKLVNDYDEICQYCQVLLGYPHAWVRLRAAKVLGQILSVIEADDLNAVVTKKVDCERGFIFENTEEVLRSLVLDLCAQYTASVTKEMADQVTQVLFQIIKLVHSTPAFNLRKQDSADDEDNETGGRLNLRWILFRMRRAVNVEVARAPNSINIRTSIFTMLLHLTSQLKNPDLLKLTDVILPPLVRELSTNDTGVPVRQLAGRLGKKLRRKIGEIEYGKMVAEVQGKLNARRAQRKKLLLQEKVNNPEKAAKRKLQLKEKKKQAKKMKLEMLHGKRPRPKKRSAEHLDLEDQLLNDE